jgi:hypothetical protein
MLTVFTLERTTMTASARLANFIGVRWRTDRPLTFTALAMIAALGVFGVGLLIDPRLAGGAPVWLKPAKFAASIAIYTLTLTWIFQFLPDWPRLRRRVSRLSAISLIAEIVIIAFQAARGVTSHFNIGTPLDATLFALMGVAIVFQTVTTIAVAVALWRQSFASPAMGWALRLGLVITIVGASLGGLMTRPTDAQLASARATGRMAISGAHTVGAVDGGPGLPGTGWSVENGDLRVPHFMGLHAVQALPLFAWLLQRRGWRMASLVRAVQTIAVSYAFLLSILVWQALRGQSVTRPDSLTLTALGVWAVATMLAVTAVSSQRNGVGAALHARG